ncbi:hypothetical protein ETD86_32895 [Nonomuraea turkmeniaca]|uniref:Uncharacterized protein n=1 Tax=Nonomuraea turkmeniaca TaxID=103838 RepID=A0A5S4F8K8_9ACTN|nr:hypothetical protein [Nonomuraea turkmeniaca]TMR12380.1 hypothetical protein ETD86_32895 [Nonomuraea turkmeniaca]
MVAGETHQEKGRKAAYFVQRWLESTTRVVVPWVVYDTPQQTTLQLLNGKEESFDLAGYFTDATKRQFYVEVKAYDGNHSKQPVAYREYLANCYSITKQMMDHFGPDKCWEFMFVTWHPFLVDKWSQHCTEPAILEALNQYPDRLAGQEPDHDIVKTLTERLWLIVLSTRHEELVMDSRFLGHIRQLVTSSPAALP